MIDLLNRLKERFFNKSVKIKFSLENGAKAPFKKYSADAGFDLYTNGKLHCYPSDLPKTIGTGLHIAIPEGYVGMLYTRSSTAQNGLTIATGVIDSGYIGEIKITVLSSNKEIELPKGTRLAQLIIKKIPNIEFLEVKQLEKTERGARGFGSTGA